MSADPVEVLKELLGHVKDDKRKSLVEAYLEQPDAKSIADKALELLSKAVDENHSA